MNEILPDFLNDAWFNSGTIKILSSDITYVNGRAIHGAETENTITTEKLLVPANAKQLIDAGLGEFAGDATFSLFVIDELVFSNGTALNKGDLVEYEGNKYKIVSDLPFKTHNFYKYIITKFKGDKLND